MVVQVPVLFLEVEISGKLRIFEAMRVPVWYLSLQDCQDSGRRRAIHPIKYTWERFKG